MAAGGRRGHVRVTGESPWGTVQMKSPSVGLVPGAAAVTVRAAFKLNRQPTPAPPAGTAGPGPGRP